MLTDVFATAVCQELKKVAHPRALERQTWRESKNVDSGVVPAVHTAHVPHTVRVARSLCRPEAHYCRLRINNNLMEFHLESQESTLFPGKNGLFLGRIRIL